MFSLVGIISKTVFISKIDEMSKCQVFLVREKFKELLGFSLKRKDFFYNMKTFL